MSSSSTTCPAWLETPSCSCPPWRSFDFHGVRVVSVADGLDSDDREATIGIQVRGVFNELQLQDLRKKTLRGQIGQKERGFSVGEATFGYRSVPVGTIRIDKKGQAEARRLPDDDRPGEAATILRSSPLLLEAGRSRASFAS